MHVESFKELDDKIVVFGQSCSGKTTFAKCLTNHYYFCFDQMFDWGSVELLGLDASEILTEIQNQCNRSRFVLDGWHLADQKGLYLPSNSSVYVIFCPYDQIIRQYRVSVKDALEHKDMFMRWYKINYDNFKNVRYFLNCRNFVEKSRDEFQSFLINSSL